MLTFRRGSYEIDVAFDVTNGGTAPIAPFAYYQLTRDMKTQGTQNSMAPVSYTGPVIYNETDKFKKIEFGEIDKLAADPIAQAAVHEECGQRLGGDGRALLRRRVATG